MDNAGLNADVGRTCRRRPSDAARIWRSLAALALAPLLVGATNGTLNVSWTPNSEPDVVRYWLYWGTASGVYTSSREILAPATSTTLTGLDPALTYYFALRAGDLAGNVSALSLEAWAQPRAVVGALPTISDVDVQYGSSLIPYLMRCDPQTIRVTGTNFQNGAVVRFTDASIVVASTTFVSSTVLTARVTAGAATSTGYKEVRVTNPDTGSGTLTGSRSVEVVKNPDFSKNGLVGAEDFNALAIAFGSSTGGALYNSAVDMNGNGTINGDDLNRFVVFLGAAVTPCP
jgi:hypothetical protein